MTRQSSILQSLGTQPNAVALRVLAVRTDAVTGLPLDVYEEPPTARFRPPGQMLHVPGQPCLGHECVKCNPFA
jgi:hypothetical protein